MRFSIRSSPHFTGRQDSRAARFGGIATGAGGLDVKMREHGKSVDEALALPVENVIVGKDAAVKASRHEASGVLGAYPVIYTLLDMEVVAGDAGFQIDDAQIRPRALPFLERCPPDIGEIDRRLDRTICLDGEIEVALRRFQIRFMEIGGAGIGQRLVDAAPRHYIAAKEDPHRVVFRTKSPEVSKDSGRPILVLPTS